MKSKQLCTNIILSGTEGDRFIETAYNQARCRSTLVSFLYAEAKGSVWFQGRLKKYPGLSIMVDSGAHSFRTEGYCEKWPDLAWFDDYALRYKNWIIANREYVDLVVNLDVDTPCGMSNMLRFDNEIFKPLERAGIPVCYVWHQSYGFDFWLEMCRQHEYVGLPGNLSEADWHKMMRPAIMNGCRVHGFAATKSFILGKIPLATSDSISWKSGEMYGQTFVFEGGRLRTYDKTQKDARLKYKAKWVSMGIDWDELQKDKAAEITKVCAIAWGDYQDHVTTMTTKLAYWNKTSQVVDEFITLHNGISNITKELAVELLTQVKCPLPITSDKQAREDLTEIRAFLARDNEVVFGLSDERIDYWVKTLGASPEKNTRGDREAEIRQLLYKWFYKIQAAEALERGSVDTVEPVKHLEERQEPIRQYPGVEVDLPDADGFITAEAGSMEEHESLLSIGQETTKANLEAEMKQADGSKGLPGPEVPGLEVSRSAIPSDFTAIPKAFSASIPDTLLRIRAGYGVDLIFEQNKLKQEAARLQITRKEPKRQKTLRQKAAALAVEVTKISEELGPNLAAAMAQAGEAAFEHWLDFQNNSSAPKPPTKALPVQAEKLQNDPALAREIGRLGGAPKGNQNARKHGLYSPKLPQLACDNCPHIQVCPQYRAGHVCAFLNEFAAWGTDQKNVSLAFLKDLLQTQMVRLRRAMVFETFEGGITSKETSKLSKDVASLAKLINDMENPAYRPQPGSPAAVAQDEKRPSILAGLFQDMAKRPDGVYDASKPGVS